VERLYRKRLLPLLPQIVLGSSVDTVLPNANGTTALHNACGLSHVEIVQWLVEHGADLNARTAKGAAVDDCIGGPNAGTIRAILRKARNSK
jgi:ankyrin repeat protein